MTKYFMRQETDEDVAGLKVINVSKEPRGKLIFKIADKDKDNCKDKERTKSFEK